MVFQQTILLMHLILALFPVMYRLVLRPVVIFKGEGHVSAAEKRLYDDRVIVLFQKKGVTDEKVDAVMEQFKKDALAAAKPAAEAKPKPKPKAAPKQLPITSFLR